MRLIDADALIDEIKHITGQDTIMWFYDRRIKREQEVNVAAFIERCPTIDPVKHGKLMAGEETNSGGLIRMVCSECNRVVYATYGVRLGEIRFCPYCGVKFDGGEDDNKSEFLKLAAKTEPIRFNQKERSMFWGSDGYIWGCSECGKTYWGRLAQPWNYCPNCGAKMEEKK